MGTYYAAYCDEFKECIHPPKDCANKFPGICIETNPFGCLLVYAMCTKWFGNKVFITNDGYDFYYLNDYKNITEEIEKEYKEMWERRSKC
jgi:hypothetical protein